MEPLPNHHFDVVIIGAGPLGMTTACTLKAIHKQLNICVLEKRTVSTRDHSLKINWDAVSKIQ